MADDLAVPRPQASMRARAREVGRASDHLNSVPSNADSRQSPNGANVAANSLEMNMVRAVAPPSPTMMRGPVKTFELVPNPSAPTIFAEGLVTVAERSGVLHLVFAELRAVGAGSEVLIESVRVVMPTAGAQDLLEKLAQIVAAIKLNAAPAAGGA